MTKQQKISLLHVMNIRYFVVQNMRIVNIICGPSVVLAPFVQKGDNAIHWINHYPLSSAILVSLTVICRIVVNLEEPAPSVYPGLHRQVLPCYANHVTLPRGRMGPTKGLRKAGSE